MLVEVTAQAGVFTVIQSWKGDLEPKESIAVPALAPGPDAEPIRVYPSLENAFIAAKDEISQQIPSQPVGSRMLLFLTRADTAKQSPTSTSENSDERWSPADFFASFKTSTVWIEGGQLYAFQQIFYPGPSVLFPLQVQLQQAKDRVLEIDVAQQNLAQAIRLTSGERKAQSLLPYVRSDIFEARRTALTELGKCGSSAVKIINETLDDERFADEEPELVHALVDAGGDSIAEELDNRLQKELAFWQATAPSLPRGWWNQDPTIHAPLQQRYQVTYELLLAIQRTRYNPALSTVRQLGDLWRSLPQLNDPTGLNQMVEECDRAVKHLLTN